MPVILGEVSILTTPLSGTRVLAIVSGCVSFSLVASMATPQGLDPVVRVHYEFFRTYSMFAWCFFFTLSLLILAITFIQFHGLLPLSWKNLTATVAALGALANFTATLAFPCALFGHDSGSPEPRIIAATVFSVLTAVAYLVETFLLRRRQGGYMTSLPGLLKTLQVFGGSMAVILVVEQVFTSSPTSPSKSGWAVWGIGVVYTMGLLGSLSTVVVMVGDCTGRCPLPFDRVLLGLNVHGVLLYMVAGVMSSIKVLLQNEEVSMETVIVAAEMAFAYVTLLSYTIDLAFSIKLLCDRH